MNMIKDKMKKDKEVNEVPSKIFITSGDVKGNIKLFWEPTMNAYSYLIQKSVYIKDKLNWKYVDISDRSDYTVQGLRAGKTYCFRIASVTHKGQGEWSRTVKKKVTYK